MFEIVIVNDDMIYLFKKSCNFNKIYFEFLNFINFMNSIYFSVF